MSVYTSVSETQLDDFLQNYSVGKLKSHTGIEAGVENTNYFVSTSKGEYVLTLYEHFSGEQVPYFLELMQHLSDHNVPTVKPVKNSNGLLVSSLCSKPAALLERLSGGSVMQPEVEHCAVIGEALAHMHLAGLSYAETSGYHNCRENHRVAFLNDAEKSDMWIALLGLDKQLMEQEFKHFNEFDVSQLPQGIIHSDLFRDNCLFYDKDNSTNSLQEVKLSGIIDLYFSGNDALLYDIAVTVNDWCFLSENNERENNKATALDPYKYSALVKAYHAVRPITNLEKQHWISVLRIAALYFWVFRFLFTLHPPEGEQVGTKNAKEFQNKITWYLENQATVKEIIDSL